MVFSGASGPPSSIACTSTGRPATTVEWYRNGKRKADADSTTVLNGPVTASYTHTLHLSQREGGLYKCFVNTINDHTMAQPVITSDELIVEGELFKQFNLQVLTFLFSTNHYCLFPSNLLTYNIAITFFSYLCSWFKTR